MKNISILLVTLLSIGWLQASDNWQKHPQAIEDAKAIRSLTIKRDWLQSDLKRINSAIDSMNQLEKIEVNIASLEKQMANVRAQIEEQEKELHAQEALVQLSQVSDQASEVPMSPLRNIEGRARVRNHAQPQKQHSTYLCIECGEEFISPRARNTHYNAEHQPR